MAIVFAKIFKFSGCSEDYEICEQRQPLFYELWSQEMIKKFLTLLVKLMKFMEQEEVMKEDLSKRQAEIEKMF